MGFKFKRLIIAGAAALVSAMAFQPAIAGAVLNPGTVINNTMGELGTLFNVNRLRDQSGLSVGYTSGVTNFATYIASNPTHTRSPDTNGWLSSGPAVLPGVMDFDLGGIYSVLELAFWNHAAGSTANIHNFRVFTSNVANFSTSTLVGTINNPEQASSSPYPVSVYDLIDTNARYVRLAIDTYYGNGCCVAIGELAFDVNPFAQTPEPTTLALVGLGLVGAGALRRRQSRRESQPA